MSSQFSLRPHNIAGNLKQMVHQEALSRKCVIEDVKKFAMVPSDICNINGMFEYAYRNLI